MDYLGEAIALGIDTLILGACIKQYFKNKRAMSMIQVLFLKISTNLCVVIVCACFRGPLFWK